MNSRNGREENSETIPFDLIIEILTRLPAKSIARFRCVSKLWESTLGSPNFTESFVTISSSRPTILFTCLLHGKTSFFSSSQPQDSSTAEFHMSLPINLPLVISRPVRGLVCGLNQRILEGKTVFVPLICNPSTRQSLTLPEVKMKRRGRVKSYFGYDPVNKQFKVLCRTHSDSGPYYSDEHQVLTLETGKKLSWRMIKCDIPHYPLPTEHSKGHYVYDGVCINGVLYYLASVPGGGWFRHIVCFDIRSEKFNCIRNVEGMAAAADKSILVNYKGKLATLQPNIVNQKYTGIQLWVLEDADNHQWSRNIYVLPPPWNSIYEDKNIYFVGMTSRGEIVLSPNSISNSFYLLYYHPERNTTKKVEIKGMEAFKSGKAYTSLDHVEDVKLMAAI